MVDRILAKLEEIERKLEEQSVLGQENKEALTSMRTDVAVIKQDVQSVKEQVNSNDPIEIRNGGENGPGFASTGQAENWYQKFRGIIEDPRINRTSDQTSFISVGKELRVGIEKYNENAQAKGTSVIKQMGRTAQSFSRNALKMTEVLLGASSVFGPHLGSCTLQEVQNLHPKDTHSVLKEYRDIVRKLVKVYPILDIAYGGWAARELIRAKLISAKEKTKTQDLWAPDFNGPDYIPSSDTGDEMEEYSDSESDCSDILEERALHQKDMICDLCEQVSQTRLPKSIRRAMDGKYNESLARNQSLKIRKADTLAKTFKPRTLKRREVPVMNFDEDGSDDDDEITSVPQKIKGIKRRRR